jgi:hypothetical protein
VETARQGAGRCQLLEGDLRGGIGNDLRRAQHLAIGEPHAGGAFLLDDDFGNLGIAADADAGGLRGLGHSLRDHAHAAFDIAPDAACAARFAHHVMQQHIAGAGRRRWREGANDGVGCQCRLESVALEPAVEQWRGGAGEQLDRRRQIVTE